MQIISNYKEFSKSNNGCVTALGNFDGIHKGHTELVDKTVQIAKENKLPAAIVTFEPHPAVVVKKINPDFRLTSFKQKSQIFEELGIDLLFVMKFDEEFSKITAEAFLEDILVNKINAKYILTGQDFIFGCKRSGNTELIKSREKKYGYRSIQIEPVGKNEFIYSSTKIRELIQQGKVDKVYDILGRNFSIAGIVEKGEGRGNTIGFHTANVKLENYIKPKYGVYVVKVSIDGKKFSGVANIGVKPTFGKTEELLEVHIFDFAEDIYGKEIEIELISYLREEKKFAGIDELKNQIEADVKQAKEALL